MKFFNKRFYLKKNKISKLHVKKDKSCNSLLDFQSSNLLKRGSNPRLVFSCKYSKSFKNSSSYETTLVTAFKLCFSIRKNF